MNMEDKIWYPAINVAGHFEADFKNIKPPKKAEEMMAVAFAMAFMQEIHQNQYWVQGVLDSEQSPDVRTICAEKRNYSKAPWCYQQDVEVVSYTKHSQKMNLADFVAKTKLGPKYAYDELTTILVHVQAGARMPTAEKWSKALMATGKNNPVLVLGLINQSKPYYRLAFVHPTVGGAVDGDISVLLKKQKQTGVMKWERGVEAKQIKNNKEKHCPFEKFGVECQIIK